MSTAKSRLFAFWRIAVQKSGLIFENVDLLVAKHQTSCGSLREILMKENYSMPRPICANASLANRVSGALTKGLYSGIFREEHILFTFLLLAPNLSRDPFNRPAGTGLFSDESRHFVPGYYHAVPLGQDTSRLTLVVPRVRRDALPTVALF
jgi:hypothetical protein